MVHFSGIGVPSKWRKRIRRPLALIYDSTSTDLDRGSVLPAFGGCNRKESGGSIAEPYLPDEASVVFELEPMQGGGGWQWIGTYESQGKMARFRVEFGPAKAIPG